MNIYLLTRIDKVNYDEYAAAIVTAISIKDARKIWPGPHEWASYKYNHEDKKLDKNIWDTWNGLKVELIGNSFSTKSEVILSDYRAG